MGVGRKKEPKELKVIRGTFRPGRENKDAPTIESALPVVPDWLSDRAKEIFETLVARIDAMHYATASHTEMLALLAMRLDEIEVYSKIIEEEGTVYQGEKINGSAQIKPRPEVTMRSEAARHAQSLLAEFGLSAASANKVVVPGKKKESKWAGLSSKAM